MEECQYPHCDSQGCEHTPNSCPRARSKQVQSEQLKKAAFADHQASNECTYPACNCAVSWGGDEPFPATMCPRPLLQASQREIVNHPAHYGGADDPYEVIKVIEAWNLRFHLGNAVKCIARAAHKGSLLEDLKKARWYLDREIARYEQGASIPTEERKS